MFATSARSVPCMAFRLSLPAKHTSRSPSFSIDRPSPKERVSVPSGPLTVISPWPRVTSTFGGSGIGNLPIRDIFAALPLSGDDAEHFAADAGGARLAVRHHALRRRDDGDAEPVHHARNVVLA